MPSVLSISSHVVAGRVGQSISTFAFERLGIAVHALPTVLYPVTPAAGAPGGASVPQELFDLLLKGLDEAGVFSALDALHVGYLRDAQQVSSVARVIALTREKSPGAPVLLDPILGDLPGGLYVAKGTADAIASELVPHADILTPNLFELSYLAGCAVANEGEAVAAARSLGVPLVVVTSAPGASAESTTLLITSEAAHRLRTVKFANAPHGTGDLLAALFLARLIRGETPLDSLSASVSSVHRLIGAAVALGADRLPHIEHQDLLIAPIPSVQVEAIA